MVSRVVVIGSANADLVVQVTRRPAGGETVLGSAPVATPGGKGANQATAAALLGADVAFLGRVGDDPHGELLRSALAGAGVDVSALRASDATTSLALIVITPDGENSIIVCAGANDDLTPEALQTDESVWAGADLVVVQLEIPPATVSFVAAECHRRGVRMLLNAAPAAPLTADVLSACDPLVVNESEASLLLGAPADTPPDELLDGLLGLGPASVVVTLGARGAIAGTIAGPHIAQAAEPVTAVVDTTGAGDAFVGGLAVVLARGGGLADGLALGTRAAAVAVANPGAAASYAALAALE